MKHIFDTPPNILIYTILFLSTILLFQLLAIRRAKRTAKEAENHHTMAVDELLSSHSDSLAAQKETFLAEKAEAKAEFNSKLSRYKAITSIEDEIERLSDARAQYREESERKKSELLAERRAIEASIKDIRSSYQEKKATYDKLQRELAIYDERLTLAELGVYEPHFDFGDSETYKNEIKNAREHQKAMVKLKTAVVGTKSWTVDGSAKKGETMISRAVSLTLRAFNNECEAAIANTRWNNINAMEKRLLRARDAMDKLNASNHVVIADQYFELKLMELRLTHEYRETLKLERDERAEKARQDRDEKRLIQEAKAAEKEEARYEKLLEKARSELGVVSSDAHQAKVQELEALLADAHTKTERAQAMAEKTKSGFVYVISNVGSFGEDVVKIGLTRRLDPSDRVKELGDASVPFLFDTHAMIYSEEAPALEKALHTEFAAQRVNAANMRKEFFKVTLDEVKAAVRRLAPDADFHTDIEAQEFYETLAKRKELSQKLASDSAKQLPASI